MTDPSPGIVQGSCDAAFASVREAFVRNFSVDDPEIGASLAVTLDGRWVVDLWGGFVDLRRRVPWKRDTITTGYSCGKGLVVLAALRASERGLLDLDERVATYWPEFAANEKGDVTVRHVLTHRSGVVAVKEDLPPYGFLDWEVVIRGIERTSPYFEPGSKQGYQALTQGFMLGELVRRVSGREFPDFVRGEILGPLGVATDWYFGVPDDQLGRVSPWYGLEDFRIYSKSDERRTVLGRTFSNPRGVTGLQSVANTVDWYQSVIPSASSQGNARALARVWGTLAAGGVHEGTALLAPATIEDARVSASRPGEIDWLYNIETRFGRGGFVLPAGFMVYGPSPDQFGHPGYGGSTGMADPDARLGIGYVANSNGGRFVNRRLRPILRALYEALGDMRTWEPPVCDER